MKRFEFFEGGIFLTFLCEGGRTELLLSDRPFSGDEKLTALPPVRIGRAFEPDPVVLADTGNMTGRIVTAVQNDPAACISVTTVIQFYKGVPRADVSVRLTNYGLLTVSASYGSSCITAAAGQTASLTAWSFQKQ